MTSPTKPVTRLLHEWRGGNRDALDELIPIVYDQLHGLAQQRMRAENPGHTLRATMLVHEAYLKLVDAKVPFHDRAHFFAIAARLMRRILVDHAKSKRRVKRGAGAVKLSTTMLSCWHRILQKSSWKFTKPWSGLHSLTRANRRSSNWSSLAACNTTRWPKPYTFPRPRCAANSAWPRHGCTMNCGRPNKK